MAQDSVLLRWQRGGGIDSLIVHLREKGFAVGASEALDAARLIARLAVIDAQAASRLDPAWLMPKLRPLLCKDREDQERFGQVFADWARLAIHPQLEEVSLATAPQAAAAEAPARQSSRWRSTWLGALLLLIALGLGYALLNRPAPVVAPPEQAVQPPTTTAQGPTSSLVAPVRQESDERFYGYFPAVRYHEELRPWVAWLLLGLGGLGLLGVTLPLATPWLGHARLSGRRIPLNVDSLRKEAERIVPPLAADVQARLERHVAGPPDLRERLQRRPPLHIRHTIEATLRNLGLLSLRYRDARLRPSYLLLVEVESGNEPLGQILSDPRSRMFYHWAERLRRRGMDVDIRLVRFDAASQAAVTCRPSGNGWHLGGSDGEPLDRLPTPPVGQRLVVVSDGGLLVDEKGNWRDWALRARFERWPQRAVFTPTEPRHWGAREDALERRERPADAGFYVMPLEEPALAAWAELVVTGRLPRFSLSRAQRYPRRLRELEDAGRLDALLDPDRPDEHLSELLGQLKHYLGENGYYWLCACAVPPVVRWEFTLLLGEQYYLNARVPPEELADYIARDYARLALLPWMRRQQMPDWLRLALLDSLSPRLQEEVRDVVRSKLGQIRPDDDGDDSLRLEQPPGALGSARRPPGGHIDTLYLGYLSGHSPRQLMMRAPREWSGWLARLPRQQSHSRWRDRIAAWRDRLLWRQGLSFFGASRHALLAAAALLAGVAAIALPIGLADPEQLPATPRHWLYREQARGIALPHASRVVDAAFSPDGRRVVTAGEDNTARLWDSASGAPLGAPLRHAGRVNVAAFSPDGRRVLTASDDGSARLWDAVTGSPLGAPLRPADLVDSTHYSPAEQKLLKAVSDPSARLSDRLTGAPSGHLASPVNFATFSPDGRRVLTASDDGSARLWDAGSGAQLGTALRHNGPVNFAAFSPDGRRVVTASLDQTARLWDAGTGDPQGAPLQHASEINRAAFSPDGRRVITASKDGTARLWDARSGAPLGAPLKHAGDVHTARFSPDGQRVVTASDDKTARLWDTATGQALGPPLQHAAEVYNAAFSPDGQRGMTASKDGTARLWDAATGAPLGEPLPHAGRVRNASFSPNGRQVVTASDDGKARLWNTYALKPAGAPLRHAAAVRQAALSPDGRLALTAGADHTARLWDARSGAPVSAPLRHAGTVHWAAFSPDGRQVVTASADRTARLWDAATGTALGPPLLHAGEVYHAAFSPDGQQVVTSSADRTARLWNPINGYAIGALLQHADAVVHATFSPDGRRVLTASLDKTARLWDGRNGTALGQPLPHADGVTDAAFSADGRRIVTASRDRTARVWDAESGTALGTPLRHADSITRVAFSPDGRRVITASRDRTARLWDAETGTPRSTPLQHADRVTDAAFSPDGRQVLTASSDQTARLWDADSGAPLAPPLQHPGGVYSAAFSADGRQAITAWGSSVAETPAATPSDKIAPPIKPPATQGAANAPRPPAQLKTPPPRNASPRPAPLKDPQGNGKTPPPSYQANPPSTNTNRTAPTTPANPVPETSPAPRSPAIQQESPPIPQGREKQIFEQSSQALKQRQEQVKQAIESIKQETPSSNPQSQMIRPPSPSAPQASPATEPAPSNEPVRAPKESAPPPPESQPPANSNPGQKRSSWPDKLLAALIPLTHAMEAISDRPALAGKGQPAEQGGALLWRVPPRPLPLAGHSAASRAWGDIAILAALPLFLGLALVRRIVRARQLNRLIRETAR